MASITPGMGRPTRLALGVYCTVGKGVCKESLTVCSEDGSETTCLIGEAAPSLELCDGLDNDCNGETDEGYPSACARSVAGS